MSAAHDMSLEAVGRHFGVTREAIRVVEVRALRKLRHPKRARLLREFCVGNVEAYQQGDGCRRVAAKPTIDELDRMRLRRVAK